MKQHFKNTLQHLTPKQRKAIPLLASGKTGKDVANAINCNPATISQWINHDQRFKQALLDYTETGLYLSQVQFQSLAQEAIAELRNLMKNAKSEQVRLKAIEFILLPAVLRRDGEKNGNSLTHKKGMQALDNIDAAQYDFNMLVRALTGA